MANGRGGQGANEEVGNEEQGRWARVKNWSAEQIKKFDNNVTAPVKEWWHTSYQEDFDATRPMVYHPKNPVSLSPQNWNDRSEEDRRAAEDLLEIGNSFLSEFLGVQIARLHELSERSNSNRLMKWARLNSRGINGTKVMDTSDKANPQEKRDAYITGKIQEYQSDEAVLFSLLNEIAEGRRAQDAKVEFVAIIRRVVRDAEAARDRIQILNTAGRNAVKGVAERTLATYEDYENEWRFSTFFRWVKSFFVNVIDPKTLKTKGDRSKTFKEVRDDIYAILASNPRERLAPEIVVVEKPKAEELKPAPRTGAGASSNNSTLAQGAKRKKETVGGGHSSSSSIDVGDSEQEDSRSSFSSKNSSLVSNNVFGSNGRVYLDDLAQHDKAKQLKINPDVKKPYSKRMGG